PRLIGNFLQEMSAESRFLLAALGTAGLISTEQYHAAKAAALREAMAGLPLFSLSVPRATKADGVASCVARVIARYL
ncbi:MAG: hypothetical protein ACRDIA_06370, partial [Actinomycetota bacterium]